MTTYRERHLAGIHAAPDADEELTKADLQARLKALGAPTTGNKDELQARLLEAQEQARLAGSTTSDDVSGLTG